MDLISIILIAISLAMDSFTVFISNSMCYKNIRKKTAFLNGILFALAQGIMPLIGFGIGIFFMQYIENVDHYIALILLGYIGIRMIIEGVSKEAPEGKEDCKSQLGFKILIVQAIATSIDALAIGISFSAMPSEVSIWMSGLIIGVITFIFSLLGLKIGKKVGKVLGEKAEIVGGVTLCLIGLKIFIEHTFF